MEALEKRVKICRLVEKMRKHPDYSQRLTLIDQSGIRTEETTKTKENRRPISA